MKDKNLKVKTVWGKDDIWNKILDENGNIKEGYKLEPGFRIIDGKREYDHIAIVKDQVSK